MTDFPTVSYTSTNPFHIGQDRSARQRLSNFYDLEKLFRLWAAFHAESEPLYSIFSQSKSIFGIFFLFLNPIHKKAQNIREHRQIQVKSNAKVDEQKPLFMTDSKEILVSIDKKKPLKV